MRKQKSYTTANNAPYIMVSAKAVPLGAEIVWRPRPPKPEPGDGSERNPFRISTAEELAGLQDFIGDAGVGKYFRIINDISLSDYLSSEGPEYNDGAGWRPIGTWSVPFSGNLDGGGHTITGLRINRPSTDFTGLFGVLAGATVTDLTLENVNVNGQSYVGGLAGFVSNDSSVTKVNVSGIVSGSFNWVGGIVGQGGVEDSSFNGNVSGHSCIGGITGLVSNFGAGSGVVRRCRSAGEVTGEQSIGGVAGEIEGISGRVENTFSTSTVIGVGGCGGVAGRVYLSGTLLNSYATGTVTGRNGVAGGIVGEVGGSGSSVRNCTALNESVNSLLAGAGRAAGGIGSGATLADNSAWDGVRVNGSTVSGTASDINGADISAHTIWTTGLDASVFNLANGWTRVSGKLPGFGAGVDIPVYILS